MQRRRLCTIHVQPFHCFVTVAPPSNGVGPMFSLHMLMSTERAPKWSAAHFLLSITTTKSTRRSATEYPPSMTPTREFMSSTNLTSPKPLSQFTTHTVSCTFGVTDLLLNPMIPFYEPSATSDAPSNV